MSTRSRIGRLCFSLAAVLATSVAQPQEPFGLDTTFRLNADTWYVGSVVPLESGKILLSGRIRFPGDWPGHFRGSVRVHSNGAFDMDFQDFPHTFGGGRATRWNDRIYIQGGQIVRRLWGDGLIDPSFIMMNDGPYFASYQGGDYHVFPDGRVLMTGYHSLNDSVRGFTGQHCLIWFSNEGYLDTTRIHRTCAPLHMTNTLHEQPDGKFLVCGTGNIYDGQPVGHTFRIHPNGDLDTTFHPGTPWHNFNAFTTLDDGRIIGSGLVKTEFDSPDSIHIVRLLPDGAIDSTFNYLLHLRNDQLGQFLPLWHTVLPDGRIVLHGNFSEVEGHPRGGIALLDADGHLLHTHFTGGGCGAYDYQGYIYHGTQGMVQAPDGSWYIFGAYHGYDDGTINDPGQRLVSRLYGLDVGVAEQPPVPPLRVWPNPGADRLHIEIPEGLSPDGRATSRVYDAQGRTVLTHPHVSDGVPVDVAALANGLYTVEVRLPDATRLFTKWMKQ
jgi:uncharacterized delta-60 repeat protein